MEPSGESVPLWAWLAFGLALLACVAVDLILHRGSRQRSRAAAITWTALWIGAGLEQGEQGRTLVPSPPACHA
jgi:hypothetical protein